MRRDSRTIRCALLQGCVLFLAVLSPALAAAGGAYYVQSGDTLIDISRMFGVDVERLRELNRLDGAEIRTGDRIRIPDASPKPAAVVKVTRDPEVITAPVPQSLPPKTETIIAAALAPSSEAEPSVEVTQRRELSSERVLQALCRDETVYHAIVKGDTLYSLANRYGTDLEKLFQFNGLRKNSKLSIGQRIIIRKSGPRTHTVRRGETLSRIAARYGFEVEALRRLNQLQSDSVASGQQLLIEPCDPYAAAGSSPPPLGGTDSSGREPGGLGTTTADSAVTISQRVIKLARTMLNVPYRFGGSTLRGIDCSAYVQRVFRLMDVQIPRTAREQYSVGARIGRSDVQVGDLVFFRTYASFPSHVGIYLGENLFIHASSMVHRVTIDNMDQPYYRKRFIGARRLVDDDAPAVASTP
jgi:peptidoglycan endopeptidase LytE